VIKGPAWNRVRAMYRSGRGLLALIAAGNLD
jgi:hypothetical protein